jgi:hypothetical protein
MATRHWMLLSFSTPAIFHLAQSDVDRDQSLLCKSKGSGVYDWYWKDKQAEIEGQGGKAILLGRR